MSSDLHLLSCSPMRVVVLPPTHHHPHRIVSRRTTHITYIYKHPIIVVDSGSEKEMKTA
ncbi:hypothetical protein SCLCIDRAFT_1211281 [Scleroderma citrinum Foug A]|uniref:Uncharacterized protein n=1 Tax=Scleroderma citrinum Foug A TaxID=1036808 RepID=A0A0C3EF40_9AGAM|nr:hypothetical protein SCLCIDRAFT_1211281 [Scleroderma citrinum Foug A]